MNTSKCKHCGKTCVDDDKVINGVPVKEADSTLKAWLKKTEKHIKKEE